MCTKTTPEFNGPSTCRQSIHHPRYNNDTKEKAYVEIHPQMITAQAIFLDRFPLSSQPASPSPKTKEPLRNRPVPSPPAPGAIAICFDLSPVTQNIYAPGIFLDTIDGLFELPSAAIWRYNFSVEKRENTALNRMN